MTEEKSTQKEYPCEVIDLPSEGYFYDQNSPLASGQITLLLPTAKHEDILTSKNLIQKGIVIDEFLKSIIKDKNIDYSELLVGDKSGILIASRILLYGSEYSANIKCRNCGETNPFKIDLGTLKIKEIDFSKFIKGINEFEFTLPYSKKLIKFKLLTHKDEMMINSYLKKIKKYETGGVDSDITTRLSHLITEIDGITETPRINQYIQNSLLSKDSLEFRKHLAEITPGMETELDFECSSCGHMQTIQMPMDINFFWPSGRS